MRGLALALGTAALAAVGVAGAAPDRARSFGWSAEAVTEFDEPPVFVEVAGAVYRPVRFRYTSSGTFRSSPAGGRPTAVRGQLTYTIRFDATRPGRQPRVLRRAAVFTLEAGATASFSRALARSHLLLDARVARDSLRACGPGVRATVQIVDGPTPLLDGLFLAVAGNTRCLLGGRAISRSRGYIARREQSRVVIREQG